MKYNYASKKIDIEGMKAIYGSTHRYDPRVVFISAKMYVSGYESQRQLGKICCSIKNGFQKYLDASPHFVRDKSIVTVTFPFSKTDKSNVKQVLIEAMVKQSAPTPILVTEIGEIVENDFLGFLEEAREKFTKNGITTSATKKTRTKKTVEAN